MASKRNLIDARHPNRQSFLLRAWREGDQGRWRGSLHSTATGELCHFDTLAALFDCLLEELGEPKPTVEHAGPTSERGPPLEPSANHADETM